ncbi:MAG: FIST signal transduction protein [Bradymonadia bacterium]
MKLQLLQYVAGQWTTPFDSTLDSEQTLILAFGAPCFRGQPEVLRELSDAFPQSRLFGCSSSGEIFDTTLSDESMAVAIIRFEKSQLRSAFATVECVERSCEAGAEIGRALLADELKGILVLSDGLHVNGSDVVRGLNSVLPERVVVTGGLAGDGSDFEDTWIIREGQPTRRVISAVGFYGDHLEIGHGSKGGWDVFGIERRITRAEGNVLYELDGKPALELYMKYLGERAAELPASALLFPLAVRSDAQSDRQLVRTVLSVSHEENTMTFAGDLPEGHLAQFMKANFERLVDGACNAALMSRACTTGDLPVLSVAISCVGRRLVLGEQSEEELEATFDVLPKGSRQIGFYSYGEISPHGSGSCDLHNQTMTLTTFAEV